MKFKLVFFLFLFFLKAGAQQVLLGNTAAGITIKGVLNNGIPEIKIEDLKGKVVVLDFWATWCAPCISGFTKLKEIKNKFKDKIVVIAISQEDPQRIRKFMKHTHLPFFFVSDSSRSLQAVFPHVMLPHVVLIDAEGLVRAITHGDEVTGEIVQQVLDKKTSGVSLKLDNINFDYDNYFAVEPTVKNRFKLTAAIPGGVSQMVPGSGVFKNRRKSFFNVSFVNLFMDAYDFNFIRTRFLNIDKQELAYNPQNLFCLDIIVEKPGEASINRALRDQLSEHFTYKAKVEKRRDTVYLLQQKYKARENGIHLSSDSSNKIWGRRGEFNGKGIQLHKVAEYLEGFSILKKPVISKIKDTNFYDVAVKWEHEKANGLEEFLNQLGLYIEKSIEEVDYLVIYK